MIPLCELLRRWCEREGLPYLSADEIESAAWRQGKPLTEDQCQFVEAFLTVWYEAESLIGDL